MLDLHLHTNVSDGSMSPTQVVQVAKQLAVSTIAITDHDNMGGVEEAQAEGRKLGVEVIAGVELSLEYHGGTMHMLGYFLDGALWHNLYEPLIEIQRHREERNRRIIGRLQQLGMDIHYDEVLAQAGRKQIGRPHFAAVMVAKGYVTGYQDAFDRYLAKGAKAYEPKKVWSPAEGIHRIRAVGGIAVLAHPIRLNMKSQEQMEGLVQELCSYGLEGIEVYHSEHSADHSRLYRKLGEQFGLVMTGGSDFHGSLKPNIAMAKGKGDLHVPAECLASLKERARRKVAGLERSVLAAAD